MVIGFKNLDFRCYLRHPLFQEQPVNVLNVVHSANEMEILEGRRPVLSLARHELAPAISTDA